MTAPSDRTFDPSCHLSVQDIPVDNPENTRVTIKQSKTDPFRKGIDLYLGKTAADLCPVRAVLNYLVVRGRRRQGPLFLFADGTYLTRLRLVKALRQALGKAGIDPTKYSGHSFRIGAVTTAAEKGMEDSVIKTLGLRRSLAYPDYIQMPREQLASYSRMLRSS